MNERMAFVASIVVLAYRPEDTIEEEHKSKRARQLLLAANLISNTSFEESDGLAYFVRQWAHDAMLRWLPHVRALVQADVSAKALEEVVKSLYPPSTTADFGFWHQYVDSDWYWSKLTMPDGQRQVAVQLNILSGVLLVQGAPPGLLPPSMVHHETILRLFGNKTLRVHQEDDATYSCAINDVAHHMLFLTFERDNPDGVRNTRREVRDGSTKEWQLISPTALKSDLPSVLLEQYSHWLADDVIEFRDVSADWSSDEVPAFTMRIKRGDCVSAVVIRARDKLALLHFQSPLFLHLYHIFHRLELGRGISVLVDPEAPVTSPIAVELHRLGLDFQLDRTSGRCTSKQLDMDVAPVQDVGTLRTLQNKLVLERGVGNRRERIVLVPSGSGATLDETSNAAVMLPPWGSDGAQVYQYAVDEDLKQLRGKSEHALLYLAFLHAFTGDSIADPFTGIPGLDMALLLLRHCKYNQPYDMESLRLLEMVVSCAPRRERYPEDWGLYEDVHWCHRADPLARSDALLLLPLLLVEEANQLAELHFKHANIVENATFVKNHSSPFHARAYFLARPYYPRLALLNSGEEEVLGRMLLWPARKTIEKATTSSRGGALVTYLSTTSSQRYVPEAPAFRAFCTTTERFHPASKDCLPRDCAVEMASFVAEFKDSQLVLLPLLRRAKNCVSTTLLVAFERLLTFLAWKWPVEDQPLLHFLRSVARNLSWFDVELPVGDEQHAPFHKHSMSQDEVYSLLKYQSDFRNCECVEEPSRAARKQAAAAITQDMLHWEKRDELFWPTVDYPSWHSELALRDTHARIRRAADVERFFLKAAAFFCQHSPSASLYNAYPAGAKLYSALFGKDVRIEPTPYPQAPAALTASATNRDLLLRAMKVATVGNDLVIEARFRSCVEGNVGDVKDEIQKKGEASQESEKELEQVER